MNNEYYNITPQIYDDQFWWKKDDIEFWKNTFNNNKKTILELAAGTGRLGLPLIKEGYKYTGIEIAQSYCDYGNIFFQQKCHKDCLKNADMRFFNLEHKYDYIFIGFNSLLHLLNEQDIYNCLQSIKKHMHTSSQFYIDIFVPSPLSLHRPKDTALRVLEFVDSNSKQLISIDEILDYDDKTEIADILWIYLNEDDQILFEFNFQMKMYYPDTMNRLLVENGFSINNLWGSYEKKPFTENSTLQIYQCNLKF